MKDKSGRQIKPGDFIVYGHAMGRCAGLRYGVVKEIKEGKDIWSGKAKEHCRVRGADDDNFSGDRRTHKLTNRDGTLMYGDRILVVKPEQMPMDAVVVLENHWRDYCKGLL